VKHVFVGIEQCLAEMTDTHRVVPTNTMESWYKNLTTLGSKLCAVQLFQDSSENWIRVQIRYACALLGASAPGKYRSFTVSNLISPAVIKCFPDLACHATFVTESVASAKMSENINPEFRKHVSLVFAKAVVVQQHETITDQMKNVLLSIETETELLKQDHLARGQLVDSVRLWSMLQTSPDKQRQWWDTEYDKLKCEFGENDPSEYWGEIGRFTSDFIAGTRKYPWMPSAISKSDDFFS
jgi:hypothetical protein